MTSPILLVSYVAVVSDNDGSAFITKAEFDSLKNNFQAQIDNYNQSIDSKIDGAIAAYLAGIKIETTEDRLVLEWVRPFPNNTTGFLGGVYTELIGNAGMYSSKTQGGYTYIGKKLDGGSITFDEMLMFKSGDNWTWQFTGLLDYERINFKTNGRATPFWYSNYAHSGSKVIKVFAKDGDDSDLSVCEQDGVYVRTGYHAPCANYFCNDDFVSKRDQLINKDIYLDSTQISSIPMTQINWANYYGPPGSNSIYVPLLYVAEGSGGLRFKWYFGNSDFVNEYKALYNMWNNEKTTTDGSYSYVHKSGTRVWLTLRQNDNWIEITPSTGNLFLDYNYYDDSWKSSTELDVRVGDVVYIATYYSANSGAMQSAAKFIMNYDNLNP